MKKKLTEKQIARLYEFTQQHYVEYYDLQTELVDHMANAIEALWEESPEIDFERSIQLVFKKFGVYGFMNVVEKRKNALTKNYWKLIWKESLNFFQVPKLLLILIGTMITYTIIQSFTIPYWILGSFLIISIIGMFFRTYQLNKKFKNKVNRTGKKWLIEEIIFKMGGIPFFIIAFYQFFVQLFIHDWNINSLSPFITLLLSFGLTFFGIIFYIIFFYLPQHAEKILKEKYPEYQLASNSD